MKRSLGFVAIVCLALWARLASGQGLVGEMGWAPPEPVSATEALSEPAVLGESGARPTEFTAPAPIPPGGYQEQYFTLDELKAEMKKLAWTKGEYRIVPYGILWASATAESQRTFTGDYPLYVLPPVSGEEEAFHVDGKSTRLGIDVFGPGIPCLNCASSGGKIEFDFQGNFITENKPGVLLRHAYVEVKNEEFRLLGGQTWDVISPLNPGVLMYSVGWGGGNIGYRRAQLRGERFLPWSDTLLTTLQGSLNVDIAQDFAGNALTVGDHSGWPLLEARVGTTLGPRGKGCRPIEFGVSGHYGETNYDFYNYDFTNPSLPRPVLAVPNVPERTWSVNADIRIPIGECWGFQGEFFTGENLSTFLGGALQGVNVRRVPLTQAFISQNTVRSTGGWFEVWYDFRPDWHTHVGYSIDDPLDTDLNSGRTYNQFYFANVVYDVTPKFIVGLEFTQWKTIWINNPVGNSSRLEFVAKYGF